MPRYFSARKGSLVTRFGTGTYIGASLVPLKKPTPGQAFDIEWNEEEIAAISDDELLLHGGAYDRLVQDDALVERSEADLKAWHAKQEEASRAEAKAAEAQAETQSSQESAAAEPARKPKIQKE